jgi:hypothetical protein
MSNLVQFPPQDPKPEPSEPAATFFSMESDICDAANAANALCMAIGGMGRMALDTHEEEAALSWLSHEASFAANKVRKLWYEIVDRGRDR